MPTTTLSIDVLERLIKAIARRLDIKLQLLVLQGAELCTEMDRLSGKLQFEYGEFL